MWTLLRREEPDTKLCGFDKRPCIKSKCAHWQHILGRHPQTGQDVDKFDCAFLWHNILAIEVAQEVRQSAAATESFRNLYHQSLTNMRQMTNPELTKEETAWIVTQRLTSPINGEDN